MLLFWRLEVQTESHWDKIKGLAELYSLLDVLRRIDFLAFSCFGRLLPLLGFWSLSIFKAICVWLSLSRATSLMLKVPLLSFSFKASLWLRWVRPDNTGPFPYCKVIYLSTVILSATLISLLRFNMRYSEGPGTRTWTSLRGHCSHGCTWVASISDSFLKIKDTWLHGHRAESCLTSVTAVCLFFFFFNQDPNKGLFIEFHCWCIT